MRALCIAWPSVQTARDWPRGAKTKRSKSGTYQAPESGVSEIAALETAACPTGKSSTTTPSNVANRRMNYRIKATTPLIELMQKRLQGNLWVPKTSSASGIEAKNALE